MVPESCWGRRDPKSDGLFFGAAQAAGAKGAVVEAVQALAHAGAQQGEMADGEEIVGDEPEGFIRGHPVLAIEASEVYGAGKVSQRAFTAEIEVDVEITQRQFAQGAVDGFAIAAAGVVGFGDGAPVAVAAIDGDDMVGVVFGFEVKDQRGISVGAQVRRRRAWLPQNSVRCFL